MLLSFHFEPFWLLLSKVEIKHDFFLNWGALLEKFIQYNSELVFFCYLELSINGLTDWKTIHLLNFVREFYQKVRVSRIKNQLNSELRVRRRISARVTCHVDNQRSWELRTLSPCRVDPNNNKWRGATMRPILCTAQSARYGPGLWNFDKTERLRKLSAKFIQQIACKSDKASQNIKKL